MNDYYFLWLTVTMTYYVAHRSGESDPQLPIHYHESVLTLGSNWVSSDIEEKGLVDFIFLWKTWFLLACEKVSCNSCALMHTLASGTDLRCEWLRRLQTSCGYPVLSELTTKLSEHLLTFPMWHTPASLQRADPQRLHPQWHIDQPRLWWRTKAVFV